LVGWIDGCMDGCMDGVLMFDKYCVKYYNGYNILPMNSRTIQHITNQRLYARNVPPVPLPNPVGFRPVNTKYCPQPPYPLPNTSVNMNVPYNIHTEFNPGDRPSPWTGYKNSVDVESILRDQIKNLGDCSRYAPNVLGDMYIVNVGQSHENNQSVAEFPHLFKSPEMSPFNPGKGISITSTFNSSTRIGRGPV
jgi:hypothetical protein